MTKLRVDIVTALPELLEGPVAHGIMRRASQKGLVEYGVHDLRDWTEGDPHRKVDDYSYGGGAGMVLKPEPLFKAIEDLKGQAERDGYPYDEVIFLTPDGERFSQRVANELSLKRSLLLVAGHYEGIDQRVRDVLITRELSVGDYVLSGGEIPSLIVVDAVTRLVPGVLGDGESLLSDSYQDDLLGAPVYTRPATFRGYAVPDVLLSGDQKRIAEWRDQRRLEKTLKRRPELLSEQNAESAPAAERTN
jgi:tRNA (guanine37-N1)-methyltransferase